MIFVFRRVHDANNGITRKPMSLLPSSEENIDVLGPIFTGQLLATPASFPVLESTAKQNYTHHPPHCQHRRHQLQYNINKVLDRTLFKPMANQLQTPRYFVNHRRWIFDSGSRQSINTLPRFRPAVSYRRHYCSVGGCLRVSNKWYQIGRSEKYRAFLQLGVFALCVAVPVDDDIIDVCLF